MISRADLVGMVEPLRGVLARVEAGELDASAVFRARLEGAVVALDAIAGGTVEEMVARLSDPG